MKESHLPSKIMFSEIVVGYLNDVACWSFQIFAIVFSTPENLLVGISGALRMKENHLLGKNVFWESAVGYLRNGAYKSF